MTTIALAYTVLTLAAQLLAISPTQSSINFALSAINQASTVISAQQTSTALTASYDIATSTNVKQPIVVNVTNPPAGYVAPAQVSSPSLGAVPTPTCSLTVSHEPGETSPMFTWTSNASSPFTTSITWSPKLSNGTWSPAENVPLIRAVGGMGQFENASGTNVIVNDNELYGPISKNGSQFPVEYKMTIGGATCDYTVTK